MTVNTVSVTPIYLRSTIFIESSSYNDKMSTTLVPTPNRLDGGRDSCEFSFWVLNLSVEKGKVIIWSFYKIESISWNTVHARMGNRVIWSLL